MYTNWTEKVQHKTSLSPPELGMLSHNSWGAKTVFNIFELYVTIINLRHLIKIVTTYDNVIKSVNVSQAFVSFEWVGLCGCLYCYMKLSLYNNMTPAYAILL